MAAPTYGAVVASYNFEEGPAGTPATNTVLDGGSGAFNGTLLDINSNVTTAPGNGTTAGPIYTSTSPLAGTRSLLFDGTNDHVYLGAGRSFTSGASNVQLSARIRINTLPATGVNQSILQISGGGSANSVASLSLVGSGAGTAFRALGRELVAETSSTAVSTSGLALAGVTYDVVGLFDYVNNRITLTVTNADTSAPVTQVIQNTTNFSTSTTASAVGTNDNANIGANVPGTAEYFNGLIDSAVVQVNVPEPMTAGLLGAGALGLLSRRRRRGT